MQCRNHPSVKATGQCAACGKSYCANCLVPVNRQQFCANCKMKAVPGGTPPPPARSGPLLPEARNVLLLAIIGLFCCAFLQPMVLGKAKEAQQKLEADPSFEGQGMAVAARIIAIASMILWALGVISWVLLRNQG